MSETRRVIYSVATSLDGFVAREDGRVDWLFTEGDFGFDTFLSTIDTLFMGRITYEQVLGFGDYPYAAKKGYVFSRSRAGEHDENVRFLDDAPSEVVEALRDGIGGHLWLVGGGRLAGAFLADDLIDEIHLAIHPIVLGSGRPLFGGVETERHFETVGVERHPSGVILSRLQRTRDTSPGSGPFTADPSVDAIWQSYLLRAGEDPSTTTWSYVADAFGDHPALADELVQLVLVGRKQATAASVLELERGGEAIPRVGDHLVVLDGRGVARCIVRTTRVQICRFEEVSPAFAAREGEGDGSLESWRREHWTYYERVLAPHGLEPSLSMDIVCEEFELVFGPSDLLEGLVDDD